MVMKVSTYLNGHVGSCASSVVLTQTHPAAPYVCRTGNITLRCQHDGVEECQMWCMMVCGLAVLGHWDNGRDSHPIHHPPHPGHTALSPTTTYQDVVVDSYTN